MRKVLVACLALAACAPQPAVWAPTRTVRPTAEIAWGHDRAIQGALDAATLVGWDEACGNDRARREKLKDRAYTFFAGAWREAVGKVGDEPRLDALAAEPAFCRAVADLRDAADSALDANGRDLGGMPSARAVETVRGLGLALGLARRCPGGPALRADYTRTAQLDAVAAGIYRPAIAQGLLAAHAAQAPEQPAAAVCASALALMRDSIARYPRPVAPPAKPKPVAPAPKAPDPIPPAQAPAPKAKPDPMFDI